MWDFVLWEISVLWVSILSTSFLFFSEWVKEGAGRFITVGEAAQLSLKTHGSILTIIFRITGTYSNGRTWQKMRFLNVLKHFKTLLLFMIIFMPVGAFRTHSILQWPHHPSQTSLVQKKSHVWFGSSPLLLLLFSWSHTELCDISLTGISLERIITTGEGEQQE